MICAVLLDIPATFTTETFYTIENLFFPFMEDVPFVEDLNELNRYRKKVIYWHERSSYLDDTRIQEDTLIILLEESTLSFFSSFQQYGLNNIERIDGIPCIFPLQRELPKLCAGTIFPFDIVAASFFFLSWLTD